MMNRPPHSLALAVATLVLLMAAPLPVDAGPVRKKVYEIADFEKRADIPEIRGEGLTVELVPGSGSGRDFAMRAVADEQGPAYVLHFDRVPRDVRAYEALAFRVRALHEGDLSLDVGLVDAGGRRLAAMIPRPPRTWIDVRLVLAGMDAAEGFDAKAVEEVSLTCRGRCAFELDDLRLVKGYGDWQTDGVALLKVFGEKRVKKAAHIRTEHFDIYTDSSGARRKFPAALEETYHFVRAALGVPEMETRLPVYIFQSKSLYTDFCVRFAGWTQQAGDASAGHACSRYFATYYQAPKSPVVTHELTHAIFHRTVGTGGGSWFQEGVAEYVEALSQGKSAASLFAPKLRSAQYASLRDFMVLPRLIASHDVKGGAFTSGSLYAQAGAFYEFLLRGPLLCDSAEERPTKLPPAIMALACSRAQDRLAMVEQCLGRSLDEVEQAWIAWGSRPPRR